jgi:Mg-chelatase subunit ChlD
MTSKQATLYILLDISGSMYTFSRKPFIDGLMDLIKKQENINRYVLTTFNTTSQVVEDKETILREDFEKHFKPGGTTAMNDAFVKTLIIAEDDLNEKIILFITDGEENASTASLEETQDAIYEAQKGDMIIMSLGISSKIAKKYGLNEELCIEFDKDDRGLQEVIKASGNIMSDYTKDLKYGIQFRDNTKFINKEGFTQEQKNKTMPPKFIISQNTNFCTSNTKKFNTFQDI